MSTAQRLIFLAIAVAVAVVAFVAIGGGGSEESDGGPAAAAPTPSAQAPAAAPDETPAATPTPTATPRPPLLTAGSGRTVTVEQGEEIRFRVRHPTAEEVHVHGYDVTRELEPGRTVTVAFPADITGIFEVELELSHQPLGTIEVRP